GPADLATSRLLGDLLVGGPADLDLAVGARLEENQLARAIRDAQATGPPVLPDPSDLVGCLVLAEAEIRDRARHDLAVGPAVLVVELLGRREPEERVLLHRVDVGDPEADRVEEEVEGDRIPLPRLGLGRTT